MRASSSSSTQSAERDTPAFERHRKALATAEACGQCGRVLVWGEPCYRVRATWGTIQARVPEVVRRLALLCGGCVSAHWQAQPATPCEACGRPVVQAWNVQRRHTLCSERCAWREANHQRNQRLAEERHKTCDHCGVAFEAPRRDMRWCSPTCRVRAYKQRRRSVFRQEVHVIAVGLKATAKQLCL
jgi:hypothetical protein